MVGCQVSYWTPPEAFAVVGWQGSVLAAWVLALDELVHPSFVPCTSSGVVRSCTQREAFPELRLHPVRVEMGSLPSVQASVCGRGFECKTVVGLVR